MSAREANTRIHNLLVPPYCASSGKCNGKEPRHVNVHASKAHLRVIPNGGAGYPIRDICRGKPVTTAAMTEAEQNSDSSKSFNYNARADALVRLPEV